MFAPIWVFLASSYSCLLARDVLFICVHVHGMVRLNGWSMSKTSTETPSLAAFLPLLERSVTGSLTQAISNLKRSLDLFFYTLIYSLRKDSQTNQTDKSFRISQVHVSRIALTQVSRVWRGHFSEVIHLELFGLEIFFRTSMILKIYTWKRQPFGLFSTRLQLKTLVSSGLRENNLGWETSVAIFCNTNSAS